MGAIRNIFRRFRKDDGATAIEYALLAALIGVGIIAAATALGTQVSSTFNEAAEAMQGGGG